MVATPSTMLPLGTEIPDFSLPNAIDGLAIAPGEYRGSVALVVMFICNHCPFVKHVLPELGRLSRDYLPQRIAFLAINSNDIETHPADSPERMRELVATEGWTFPFLFDESQETAKAFKAACTPDFYVFDGDQRLVYRGQLDGSRPKNDIPVTGADLRNCLDAIVAGKSVPAEQQPSLGCNIKWKPGNAPQYFPPGK
ncbi:MAG: thioredoxin family protein [Gemmatimonadota bacterium]|nr:thioredoxin family protein [Gemmatimonadota bacterium]